jgi:hypothetical protein
MALHENVIEVGKSGLQAEFTLSLLRHCNLLAPSMRGIELSQILCDQRMRWNAVSIAAYNSSALRMDSERIRTQRCLGLENDLCKVAIYHAISLILIITK